MPLTETEWKQAQLARREILERDNLIKGRFLDWLCLVYIFCLLILYGPFDKPLHWAMPFGFLIFLAFKWMSYPGLKSRYAANLQVLEELRQREPHLYASLTTPKEMHPLLENWSRSLEKRAILWRVDRFLSGGQRD